MPNSDNLPEGNLSLRVTALEKDTNGHRDVYAGWLVEKMDLAASSIASRIAHGRTATVSISQLDFLSPVRVGAEVSFYTRLTDTGNSSMRISVEVWTRDPSKEKRRKVTEGVFVLVAIDSQGRIRPVPEKAS